MTWANWQRHSSGRADVAVLSNLGSSWRSARGQLGSLVFRGWTAFAVLAAYVYAWVYAPEILTWWKRSTTRTIEAGCDLLPYPWGDRIEATLGNFGLWVQITLAIMLFRFLVWLAWRVARRIWARRGRPTARPFPGTMHDSR